MSASKKDNEAKVVSPREFNSGKNPTSEVVQETEKAPAKKAAKNPNKVKEFYHG